jgi:hypothetical protein
MNYVYDDSGVHIKNMANTAVGYGISQYRFAHCYELAGQEFSIAADEKVITLAFKDCGKAALDGQEADYECLKLEKDTYFIRIGLNFAVLDLEQSLVTLIRGDTYVYGVLASPDHQRRELHHPTADMVGTRVRWILGCDRYVDHDYFEEGKVRAAWSPRDAKSDIRPCKATKIKGPIYLADIAGRVPRNVCAPFFTNRVLLLQDYDRMMLVGCILGTGFDPIMISGYAQFPD